MVLRGTAGFQGAGGSVNPCAEGEGASTRAPSITGSARSDSRSKRRGAACNTAELCGVLWESKPDTAELRKYLRKMLSGLVHSLEAVGAGDVLVRRRNSFAIAVDTVDCDYYRLLARDIAAINTYTGEYMTQYSWAEMTLGSIRSD